VTYFIVLEAVTIFLAFLVKLIAFYFLIKFFNRTIKFSTVLKPILLYEMGFLVFILISETILFYPMHLFSSFLPAIIVSTLYFLIFVIIAFLIFHLAIRTFSIMSWKKSLVVFLLIFILITPAISSVRIKALSMTPVSFSADEISELNLSREYLPFQSSPLPIKVVKIFDVLDNSILEGKFLKELYITTLHFKFRFVEIDREEKKYLIPQDEIILEEIAYKVMEDYLDTYKSSDVPIKNRLRGYLIKEINIDITEDQCFGFSVLFSVETFRDIDDDNWTDWVAENGELSGNWVNNKFMFIDVLKENNNYKIINMGTGRGSSSCMP